MMIYYWTSIFNNNHNNNDAFINGVIYSVENTKDIIVDCAQNIYMTYRNNSDSIDSDSKNWENVIIYSE